MALNIYLQSILLISGISLIPDASSARIERQLQTQPIYEDTISGVELNNNDYSTVAPLGAVEDITYRSRNDANDSDIKLMDGKSVGLGDSLGQRLRNSMKTLPGRSFVRGKYRYLGPDGRVHTINYISDRNGIRQIIPSTGLGNMDLNTLNGGLRNQLPATSAFSPLPIIPLQVGYQNPLQLGLQNPLQIGGLQNPSSNALLYPQQANKLNLDYLAGGQYATGDSVVVVTPRPQTTTQSGLVLPFYPQQIGGSIGALGQLPYPGINNFQNILSGQQFGFRLNPQQQFVSRQFGIEQGFANANGDDTIYRQEQQHQQGFLPGGHLGLTVNPNQQQTLPQNTLNGYQGNPAVF